MHTNNHPNRLKEFRQKTGHTQKEIATLLGHTSTARLSQWEQGKAYPSLPNLLKLAQAYKTSIESLYGDTPELPIPASKPIPIKKQPASKKQSNPLNPHPRKSNQMSEAEQWDMLAELFVEYYFEQYGEGDTDDNIS